MAKATLFFRYEAADWAAKKPEVNNAGDDFRAELWRPKRLQLLPPGRHSPPFFVFAAMHGLGLFGSDDFSMMIMRDADGCIAHSSVVFPPFARFPFMAPNDLQIGATFTHPRARGRGLAGRAIAEIVEQFHSTTGTFWYLTDAENAASIAVVCKAGFAYAGSGSKRPRLGSKMLGYYSLDSAISDDHGFNT